MGLFELNKISTVARQNGFIIIQINKLTIKIYSNLLKLNICYYLKHRIPMCHRIFCRKISLKKELKEILCKDLNNLFHFA